ncbi:BTAD domain-containing putative transcriptional regulator [soil metagenome]
MPMNIQLLGSPEISLSNCLTPVFKTAKAEGLFYYLAATQRTHSRAALATLFWGDMAESKARVNLSKALSELREQIGDYVTIATQTVVFNAALPYQLDVEVFLAITKPQKADEALTVLQAQVELYRGDFLDGFYARNAPEFERWQLMERERLRIAAAQRFSTLATRYQQSGDLVNAISTLRRLLVIDPWREEVHHQLMDLLVHNGEPHAALRQYELCRLALADELDVEPGEQIARLYAKLRANSNAAGPRERPAALSVVHTPAEIAREQAKPTHHLPHPPTEFVGREAEIKTLVVRLQDPACRLLTLVGPGGIGKTRLALEVARTLSDIDFAPSASAALFPEGLFFVSLMSVDTAASMIATIAEAIGFTFYNSAPPQQQLFSYLKARKILLILDNFEHLHQAAGTLVAELLAAAPTVKLLVTSRETLPLQAAYFHAVQGLTYPIASRFENANGMIYHDPTDSIGTEDAASTDAVRLFVQRAQRHQATFALPQNLDHVVTICRLVGGMPLALELAAAWLKSLSCAQIAHDLAKGVALLHTNLLDIPERHRNMHMVFEQTWQRLSEQETTVMQRLAIFRGGFSLTAAEQVAQASIHTLAALAEKALIRLDEAGRYQVHELLRQFAHEKLTANHDHANATAAAHANFFLNLAIQLKSSLADRRQQAALATLQADIDNLRMAWLWAMQQPKLPGIAQSLDSIYEFFLFTCRYSEGKELFMISAALLDNATVAVQTLSTIATRLTTRAAVFAYHLGEHQQPSQHFQALLAAARPDEAQRDLAIAHMILGQIAGWQGNHAEAEMRLQESVALYQVLGDRSNMASVLHGMAEMQAHSGAYQKAVHYAQACLEIGIRLGRADLIGNAHCTLGYAHKSLGQPKLALEHYQQGRIYSEKTGDRLAYALAVGGVGIELSQLGKKHWTQGIALIQQSLAICREIGHRLHIATRLFSLGVAYLLGDRYVEAFACGEECIQIATEAKFSNAMIWGLWVLGEGHCDKGDFALSRLHLQRAIYIALEGGYYNLNQILILYVLLLEREASQLAPTAALQNRIHAVTLATAALRCPAWYAMHRRAEHVLERQRAFLTEDQFAAAQAVADRQTIKALATQILAL